MKRVITIVVDGHDEDEMLEAFQEAVHRINSGNREGSGRNDTGGFSFEIKYEDDPSEPSEEGAEDQDG